MLHCCIITIEEKQLSVGLSYGDGASRLSAEMAFVGVTDVDEKGETYLEDSAILSEVTYQIAKSEGGPCRGKVGKRGRKLVDCARLGRRCFRSPRGIGLQTGQQFPAGVETARIGNPD